MNTYHILLLIDFQIVLSQVLFVKESVKNRDKTLLNVLARDMEPFIITDALGKIRGGLDHALLQMIADEMNFQINYTRISKNAAIGQHDIT